jgi:hypothetical protein
MKLTGVKSTGVLFFRVVAIVKYACARVVGIGAANIQVDFKVIAVVVTNADTETVVLVDVCSCAGSRLN